MGHVQCNNILHIVMVVVVYNYLGMSSNGDKIDKGLLAVIYLYFIYQMNGMCKIFSIILVHLEILLVLEL